MESNQEQARQELADLRQRVADLESQLSSEELEAPPHWEATGFYTGYYVVAGFVLGMFAAMTSLLVNVVGAAGMGMHPLRLIQVYLTFPLGERALELEGGRTLIMGCCLYIATGMLFGAIFHVLLARVAGNASTGFRLVVASVLAAGMWLVHFYLILSWLQPMLFGGAWIVERIPWWVGLATHLFYGWTMALLYPLGQFIPYRGELEAS